MSLGLQYKNQEHIFDEKAVDGVPFLSYPMLEEIGNRASWIFYKNSEVSARDAGQL